MSAVLNGYVAQSPDEAADMERIRTLIASGDAYSRALPLHLTGSALIVHPPTRRVLLRWHQRMQSWLQVGGHADPGEIDPFVIAAREAREETGLVDLMPWPDMARPRILQVAIVPVPAGSGEPAHEHADVRYGLATAAPQATQAENEAAQLAWLSIDEALQRVAEDNLHVCLHRVAAFF
jgi:8-oxo-dGTP pyrophosphatase MutT (NUDIX family)